MTPAPARTGASVGDAGRADRIQSRVRSPDGCGCCRVGSGGATATTVLSPWSVGQLTRPSRGEAGGSCVPSRRRALHLRAGKILEYNQKKTVVTTDGQVVDREWCSWQMERRKRSSACRARTNRWGRDWWRLSWQRPRPNEMRLDKDVSISARKIYREDLYRVGEVEVRRQWNSRDSRGGE